MYLAKEGESSTTTVDDSLTGVIVSMKLSGYIETTENTDPLMVLQANGSWSLDLTKLHEAVTAKADETILTLYSELKQRKLMSIAIALQDKHMNNPPLTVDEEALLQMVRDTNAWITSIRTIENTAITNNTLLEDIVWA